MCFWDSYSDQSARYDATDAANLVLDDSGLVAQALDLSGNERHVSQDDPARRPLLAMMTPSLTGLQGDIVNEPYQRWLGVTGLSLPSPRTVVAVVKAPENARLRFFAGGTFSRIGLNSLDKRRIQGSWILEGGDAYVANTVEIWVAEFNLMASYLWVNGVRKLAGTVGNVGGPETTINLLSAANGNSATDGQLGEYVRFGRVLTSAEKNQIGQYLAGKWGLSWTTIP